MKLIKELLESRDPLLDKISRTVTKLVLDNLRSKNPISQMYDGDDKKLNARLQKKSGAESGLKSDAFQLSRSTDRFWSDNYHRIHEILEDEDEDDMDDFMQAVGDALYDVGDKVIEFYTNKWNHGPGYEAPDIEFDADEITNEQIENAFYVIPEFRTLQQRDKAREAREKQERAERDAAKAAQVTEAQMKMVGAWIDANWEKYFGTKKLADIEKNYRKHGYQDWFPEGPPKTADDAHRQMTPRTDDAHYGGVYDSRLQVILEFMYPGYTGPKKITSVLEVAIRNKQLAEKIAAHSTRLQEVLKRHGHS